MSMEEMNQLSVNVNGQSQVPPGFRFHPTEEELLHYYLRKKVCYEKIDLDVIRDVDLNKLEPWDIQDRCKIGSTPQNDWYFFSHKDKKYPTGTRTNRATAAGFWKATGRDKVIYSSFRRIGMRKTLVFYKGRAPHGQKSDWIMHEYRLDENTTQDANASSMGEGAQEDGWVVCRVFKKKNYHKALESPQRSSTSMDSRPLYNQIHGSNNNKDGVLDQILVYMGRSNSCKQENEFTNSISDGGIPVQFGCPMIQDEFHTRFFPLPRLESATTLQSTHAGNNSSAFDHVDSATGFKVCTSSQSMSDMLISTQPEPPSITNGNAANQVLQAADHHNLQKEHQRLNNWGDLDRLVASQLNGQMDSSSSKQLYSCYGEPNEEFCFSVPDDHRDQESDVPQLMKSTTRPNYTSDMTDLWSFARSNSSSSSSPDPLCHLSV